MKMESAPTIVTVVETQMKYRKMDWSNVIQMVDKMRK